MAFGKYDMEAAKILDDFLPEKIYDAHCHLTTPAVLEGVEIHGTVPTVFPNVDDYRRDMAPIFSGRQMSLNFFTMVSINKGDYNRRNEAEFVRTQLDAHPDCSAEVVVLPDDDEETIERQLVHPNIRGFKCYHSFIRRENTFQAAIGEYLPESAWRVADRHGMCITLHMVRDHALADPVNLNYIKEMSKRYPNAVLILAHAARAFASWTGVETIGELQGCDNVWFDVAAVCESPAIFTIFKKIGPSRCMWGSDYPLILSQGRVISIADSFYWIYPRDIEHFVSATPVHTWTFTTENLMATRQACLMAELNRSEIDGVFYGNAAGLFGKK